MDSCANHESADLFFWLHVSCNILWHAVVQMPVEGGACSQLRVV